MAERPLDPDDYPGAVPQLLVPGSAVFQPTLGPAHNTTRAASPTNPRVTQPDGSYTSPDQPGAQIPRKVIKGSSHRCAPNYCLRYRPAARQAQMIDTSMSHLGFRCIRRPEPTGRE